ncbi:5-formyltetrahydrofolate cyclo-ligase [Parasteatoda tepidariorum]|nr:5-formyltetrahydrofolate cyclo-ligase [Parasteatoda tepidariorum]
MAGVATAALRAAKAALRGELKKRIASIPHGEQHLQSKLITEKVLANSRFKNSHRVSIYLSIHDEIRVQTVGILEQLLEQDKECFVPKFTPNSHDMAMLKIHSLEDYAKLVADNWEILPPTEEDLKREDAHTTGGLDLMIVPGLAFTKRGHRLGGGKGYYDVYVQNCSHDPHGRPYTIGLAFKEQILHSIPVDVHDFMVDEVIYPD